MPWAIFVAAVLGILTGYSLCTFGTWLRIHDQESHIRALAVDIRVLMDMDDEVPPEWVLHQLETMVGKDYR